MPTKKELDLAKVLINKQLLSRAAMQRYLDELDEQNKSGKKITLEQLLIQDEVVTQQELQLLQGPSKLRLVHCSNCKMMYSVREEDVGKKFKCRKCKKNMIVPKPGETQSKLIQPNVQQNIATSQPVTDLSEPVFTPSSGISPTLPQKGLAAVKSTAMQQPKPINKANVQVPDLNPLSDENQFEGDMIAVMDSDIPATESSSSAAEDGFVISSEGSTSHSPTQPAATNAEEEPFVISSGASVVETEDDLVVLDLDSSDQPSAIAKTLPKEKSAPLITHPEEAIRPDQLHLMAAKSKETKTASPVPLASSSKSIPSSKPTQRNNTDMTIMLDLDDEDDEPDEPIAQVGITSPTKSAMTATSAGSATAAKPAASIAPPAVSKPSAAPIVPPATKPAPISVVSSAAKPVAVPVVPPTAKSAAAPIVPPAAKPAVPVVSPTTKPAAAPIVPPAAKAPPQLASGAECTIMLDLDDDDDQEEPTPVIHTPSPSKPMASKPPAVPTHVAPTQQSTDGDELAILSEEQSPESAEDISEGQLLEFEEDIPESQPVQETPAFEEDIPEGQPVQETPAFEEDIPEGQPIQMPEIAEDIPEGSFIPETPSIATDIPEAQSAEENTEFAEDILEGQPVQMPEIAEDVPEGQPVQETPEIAADVPEAHPVEETKDITEDTPEDQGEVQELEAVNDTELDHLADEKAPKIDDFTARHESIEPPSSIFDRPEDELIIEQTSEGSLPVVDDTPPPNQPSASLEQKQLDQWVTSGKGAEGASKVRIESTFQQILASKTPDKPVAHPSSLTKQEQQQMKQWAKGKLPVAPPPPKPAAVHSSDVQIIREVSQNSAVVTKEVMIHSERLLMRLITPEIPTSELDLENEMFEASKLSHDHILSVYELKTYGSQMYYTAQYMDNVEDLRHIWPRTAYTPKTVVQIGMQLLQALVYAHNQNVIHGFLDWETIQLQGYHAFIRDFGLSSLYVQKAILERQQGKFYPIFMSPEQLTRIIESDPGKQPKIDRRSDIYSLGMVLYWMVTQRPPFKKTDNYVQCISQQKPVAPAQLDSSISTVLSYIIMKAISKAPNERYPSAQEMMAEFSQLEQEE